MKSTMWCLWIILACKISYAQDIKKGRVVVSTFLSTSIQGNHGGEDAVRRLTIYLPPGYHQSNQHYPTIYFLHGYSVDDSSTMAQYPLNELLDTAIANGLIGPVILVLPNSYTHLGGSLYTNSTFTGNWADFIGKDVVEFVDKNFLTIPKRNSRGVVGISMGGYGALKMGMLYPDIFGSVYATSPGLLNWPEATFASDQAYKSIGLARNEKDILNDSDAVFMSNFGRTFSPNGNNPPSYAEMPAYYIGDSIVVNMNVVKKWEANFATNMIENHLPALTSLIALKIEWGRNDENKEIPPHCLEFSKRLERFGIKHFAEEYIGGHIDKLGGKEGRIYMEILPFFNSYLKFEDITGLASKMKKKKG